MYRLCICKRRLAVSILFFPVHFIQAAGINRNFPYLFLQYFHSLFDSLSLCHPRRYFNIALLNLFTMSHDVSSYFLIDCRYF